jgi:nucleotide-binding universal stress UspA family protein/RimJ/RimL family protein N-acetyltransferase
VETTLRDGAPILIRALEPDDREALAEGFARLSPESRYRRFFAPAPELRERDLDHLMGVDHHDHEALVAVDARTGEGIGVARYVRIAPEVAEPAIVVADDWQRRGVATRLLDALVARAREEGVRRFEAPVLASNDEALRLLGRLGTARRRQAGGEVQVSIELPEAPEESAGWRTLLREFATGALRWSQRRTTPRAEQRNVVVVGTDGSGHAAAAVRAAAELALAADAAVEVVAARPLTTPDRAGLEEAVGSAAQALRARGLHVHEHVQRGEPAQLLVEVAAERRARLLVVGAGERGKLARRVIGSVADHVAERAPCDVLVVR